MTQKVGFLAIENNFLKDTLCPVEFLLCVVGYSLVYVYFEKNSKLKQRNRCQVNCCRCFVSICIKSTPCYLLKIVALNARHREQACNPSDLRG